MSGKITVPDLRGRQASYLPFLAAALLFSLLGGFVLAVSLPIDAALRHQVGASWYSHAQVHGHLQTIGFAGLFIVGVSYFLMPGFSGRPLAFPRLAPLALWLLVAGVLLRTIGQPMADRAPMAALLAVGAWLEVAGAACYAANVAGTTALSARRGEVFAVMFMAGAGWFLAQAVVGAIWLTELASDGVTVLPAARSSTLVTMQVFGFHLAFIVGMVLHVFPTFFATKRMPPPVVLGAAALVQAGVAAIIVARLVNDGAGADAWLLEDAGHVAFGAGLLWAGALTGWWRGPTHMTRIARRFAAILWPAMLWLAAAAALTIVFAVRAIGRSDLPSAIERDAVLHIVTIGVVLMLIIGMAQLLLPQFASERIGGPQSRWRSEAFGVALSAAVVLRAGGGYFKAELPGESAHWAMAVAGMLGLLAALAFALLLLRSARHHERLLARMRAGVPLSPSETAPR
ncbi:MAG: NnrS family protein [Dehalococcoidia bacterium]